MENFTFHNPTKIIFGKGTISGIGPEMKRAGFSRILLLAGSGSIKKNGVYEQALISLNSSNIEITESWGVRANPTLSHAEKSIDLARKNNIEAVLAIGGGSVIDEAKSIAAGFYIDNLWDAFEKKASIEKALPIYTILTLSGTGSEMDSFAVLSNEEEQKKWNIGSPLLYPKTSIIDPSAQMSLPWEQTVFGAIDAMSHIMEFYFLGKHQESTIALDESLMHTIINCVDNLQKDHKDYNLRANLAWSATMALNGITSLGLGGGDWASHRIEHGISALHPDVAHGAGLAIIFPAWIKYMFKNNPNQFHRWSKNIWNGFTVEDGIINMKKKFMNWGAPTKLRDIGIHNSEFEEIADNALRFGDVGFMKKFDKDDIIKILQIAF